MGLSLFSAIIGSVFVAIGVILLILRRYKKTAIVSLIVGGFLIIVPVSLIYPLFD
jgi:hypothetical protein